jgi:RHS repeat-associated protein
VAYQALPFTEPATGLAYIRNRWYDPSTGTFLSPDPLGYKDSSNLYAFAGGDPVNGRDPTGEGVFTDAYNAAVKEVLRPNNGVLTRATFGVLAVAELLPAGVEQIAETIIDTPSRVWRNSGGLSNQVIATTKAKSTDSRIRHASAALGHGSQLLLDATVIGGTVENALARQAEKSLAESALRGLAQGNTEVVAESVPAVSLRINPRHAEQAANVEELDALITRLGERAVRHGAEARAAGMSGVEAGNLAEARLGQYMDALNNRLAANASPYLVEWQPATLPGYGRVPAFVEYANGQVYPFPNSLRLDAALSDTRFSVTTPSISVDVYPTILRGYDVTLDAAKVSAVAKYQQQFGVPIRDIRPH